MSDLVTAYLARVSVTTSVEDGDRSLCLDMPWTYDGTLRVEVDVTHGEEWDRIEAYVTEDPVGAPRDRDRRDRLHLTVALVLLGLSGRLTRRVSGCRWEESDLLAQSLAAHLGHPAEVADIRSARGGLARMARDAGFDPAAELDLAAIRLLDSASDVEPETYELAFRLRATVAAACEAFPMLAYEILTSESVNDEGFDGDVEALMLSGRLDRGLSIGASVEPMAEHVVAWLRGLDIQSPAWTRDGINLTIDIANACRFEELPRSDAELRAFMEACEIAYGAFIPRDLGDVEFEDVLAEYLAEARPGDGIGSWADVLPIWRAKSEGEEL